MVQSKLWQDVKFAINELRPETEDLIQTLQLKENLKLIFKPSESTEKRKLSVPAVSEL